jgi:hypothetical protein
MKSLFLTMALLFSILAGLVLTGCDRSRVPNVELVQDMMV